MLFRSKHSVTPPPALRERVANLPVKVEQVLFKALAKEPHDRFPTIRAFAEAFEQASQSSEDPRLARPASLPGRTWLAEPGRSVQTWDHSSSLTPKRHQLPHTRAQQNYLPSPSLAYNQAELKSFQAGQVVATFLGHHAVVRGLAWSHDSSKLVTTGEDGRASIWNVA